MEDAMIPVFSVLKKGTTLKNIFLNNPPPGTGNPLSTSGDHDPILIGRHPDCNIVVDHPSISRFHLEILPKSTLQKLFVTDRSSVHGTWVSGKKIQPNVPIELNEGDTLRLGASTRIYRLHWMLLSRAFDMEKPMSPLLEEPLDFMDNCDVLQESTNCSCPLEDNGGACESLLTCAIQPEREEPSTLRSGQRAKSSSLLSRRNKSIGFLEIERTSKEYNMSEEYLETEEQLAEASAGGNGEDNSFVLLNEVDVKGEEEESFVSDMENASPVKSIGSRILKSNRRIGRSELSSFSLFNNDVLEIEEHMNGVFVSSRKNKVPSSHFAEGNVMDKKAVSIASDNMTPANSDDSKVLKSNLEIERPPLGSFSLINKEALDIERPLVLLTEGDMEKEEREGFSSGKENLTPANSIGSKRLKSSRNIDRSPLHSFSTCDEEHYNSDKENQTTETVKDLKSNNVKSRSRLMKEKEDFSNANKLNCLFSPDVKLQRSLFKAERSPLSEKAFNVEEGRNLPDAEMTPKAAKSSKTNKAFASDLLKAESEENEAFASDKENLTPNNSIMKLDNVLSESHEKTVGETMKRRKERIPFQALFEGSPLRHSSPASYIQNLDDKYCNKSATNVQKSEKNTFYSRYKKELPHMQEREKKKWYIVVDVGCFLDEESRKSLQLLEGIRGTQLIIPRIVIRELDHLKRCQGILSRGTKASSILHWIEECMVKTSWWIHVQSTSETLPAAPTPPATPRSQLCDGTSGFGPVSSNFTCFSTCGSLMEIVSPTAEDHILDCALLFKRIRSDDGQLMLLTTSTTLRIKAMAEGLLCETPKEFRESLVNPFSKRFLWTDSSPRGSTWSCLEEVVLAENYHQQFAAERSLPNTEGTVKGLKFILLHSSHF